MRKISLFLILVITLGTVIVPNVVQMDKDDPSYFDQWRPDGAGLGCHDGSIVNTHVSGKVVFNVDSVHVLTGEDVELVANVVDFGGAVTSNDLYIGFNELDADNAEFTFTSVNAKLTMSTGDSTNSYTTTVTAPDTPGAYTLLSYAVTGDTSYFDYVLGGLPVTVGAVGDGIVESVIAHLDNAKENGLTAGYKWVETDKTGDTVYKSGMIKGTASIGNYMLDFVEEKTRSSLFRGLNTEEVGLALDLAIGAGDWLISIASSDANGTFWYEAYDATETPTATTVPTSFYGGVSGIASFLARLYRVTHDVTYLNAANAAMNYLIGSAYDTDNSITGIAWAETTDAGADKLSTRWSKGGPGVASVFLEMYRLTGNVAYYNAAYDHFLYLDSAKTSETVGVSWSQYNSASSTYLGRWHGVAGVVSFLIDLYEVNPKTEVKTLITSAMDYIVSVKENAPKGGIWWENAVGSGEHQSGWSRGAAGIGSVLIRADAVDNTKGYISLIPSIYDYYMAYADTTQSKGYQWSDAINTINDANSQYKLRTSIGHGAAGIGVFWLQAYQTIGDAKYRQLADGIAIALDDIAFTNEDGIAWSKSNATTEAYVDHYVYYGIAGIASFFLEYENKGDYEAYNLAKDATNYLVGFADITANEAKWKETDKTGENVYKSGTLKGASGNALELLSMYQREATQVFFGGLTSNASYSYLDVAMKAMNWLQSVAHTQDGGLAWYEIYDETDTASTTAIPTGYYAGAAGIADVFTRVSQASGVQSYMTTAANVATALLADADTSNGYAWGEDFNSAIEDNSTRWAKGSPGIGTFLLNLYVQTGNAAYLTAATGIYDNLLLKAQTAGDGKFWSLKTAGTDVYVGRWHGVAGIANYLLDLYAVTKNEAHLTLAKDALEYVLDSAIIVDDTVKWENRVGGGEFQSGFSRGSAGIGSTLLRAYGMTANGTYLDYVKMAVNWYGANTVDVAEGWAWLDSNTVTRILPGLGHGSAGIIMFATEAYEITKESSAMKLIVKATDHLEYTASASATWFKSNKTTEQYVPTTLYYGVAGAAFGLLEASMFTNFAPTLDVTFGSISTDLKVSVIINFADDLGIDKVELKIDDEAFATIDIANGGTYEIDATTFAAGTHTVAVKVTDVIGLSTELSGTFTVPEIEISDNVTTTPPPASNSEEGGFLPFNMAFFLIAFIAIPVLRKRK